jgi:transcriptional regulator with XRE-family HTH domain
MMRNREQASKVGAAIAAARAVKGYSLKELSYRSFYSTQHLSRIENGHNPATIELVTKVSEVLDSPQLLVVFWKWRVETLSSELKEARTALKEARARASS